MVAILRRKTVRQKGTPLRTKFSKLSSIIIVLLRVRRPTLSQNHRQIWAALPTALLVLEVRLDIYY